MKPRSIHTCVAFAFVLFPAVALASDEIPEGVEVQATPESHPVTTTGVDVLTAYVFRAIPQETQGTVVQPYVELALPLLGKTDSTVRLNLSGGIWSSAHTGPTGAPQDSGAMASWYEADVYAKATLVVASQLTLAGTYTLYSSPIAAFKSVQELALALDWQDRGRWQILDGRFLGFSPGIVVANEIYGTASGTKKGTYLGAALKPALAVVRDGPVTIICTVPLELHASLKHYYDDDTGGDTVGAMVAGLVVTANLGFIPARLGSWSVTAGARAYRLGSRMAAKTDRDSNILVGSVGTSATW